MLEGARKGGISATHCTPQGASDGGSRQESGLATGKGKGERFPRSPKKRHQNALSWAATPCAEPFPALPCPSSLPATRWQIPPTQSEPAAFPGSAFARGCGEMAFLFFPSKNYGAIWISKSSRAAGLTGSCSLQKEGGGSCPTDTPSFVLPCCWWGCWKTASRLGLGGCLHTAGLRRKLGVVFSAWWVERKGKEDVNLGKRSGML